VNALSGEGSGTRTLLRFVRTIVSNGAVFVSFIADPVTLRRMGADSITLSGTMAFNNGSDV